MKTEEEFDRYVRAKYGDCAEGYLELAHRGAGGLAEMKANATYNSFELGNVLWLDLNARKPVNKMYFYRFDPEIPGWDDPGAFHSSDLWFVFKSLEHCWRPWTQGDWDLSEKMLTAWTNFAKTSDPGLGWEPYTKDIFERHGITSFGP